MSTKPRRSNRGFNRGAQGQFRELVARAWKSHAFYKELDFNDKAAEREWYEGILSEAVGVTSTTQLTASKFSLVMAAFEIELDDGSTHWQLKAATEAERQTIWKIRQELKKLNATDEYAEAILSQMGYRGKLDQAPAEHLNKALIALKQHVKRKKLQAK